LSFKKQGKEFKIEDSSSGEYHFISGFIGLLAKIQENTLILIDEPENSLHPNWQMKYISFLKSIFKQFKSCHFIVATHSHFLVSDLDGNSSNINVLRKRDIIEAELIPANTYGWSAEEILLNVFQTPSTRNYYLAEELGNIFQLISEEPNERNVSEIKSKIEMLKKLDLTGLSKADPLKDVVEQLFKKFANV
jgi:predicted ATP-binding protein involved in virulence